MITSKQALYLIDLPKKIVENELVVPSKLIVQDVPFAVRINLLSEQDDEYSFLLEVSQSKRKSLKLTLHLQENEAHYGLVRIDFNGRHKNPEIATENLPLEFVPFAAAWLDEFPGHIHYVVDGYKPLAWAIPLEKDPFPIKEIQTFDDITNAFLAFCRRINIQTKITVREQKQIFI